MNNYQYYSKKGAAQESFPVTERMAIAGNCATEALSQVIKGYFADHQIGLDVVDLGYDTATLSVLDDSSPLYANPVTFLVLYFSPLKLRDRFYQSADKMKFAEDFETELTTTVEKLRSKNITALITSMPTALERCFGNASPVFPQSLIYQLEKINTFIKDTVRKNSHCHLLDVEHIAARTGLERFHSEKLWLLGKYPCHTNFFPDIAASLFNVYRAMTGQTKKVIVFDLDNTIWGGMIGEDGLSGIALGSSVEGEAFKNFQYYLRSLKEKGYLLSVCSKNDFPNAVLPFRDHPEMVLKEDDITLFVANWEPKSANIRAMADTLNLGLDAFVFIDDSAFERNEVRAAHPQILVPELNDDPAEYVSILDQAAFLDNLTFTELDRQRSEQYKTEAKRQMVKNTSANIDDYLSGLEMKCLVEEINQTNVERASQLILRSNQFNLRTQRVSRAQLEAYTTDKNFITQCFTLSDRFGDYGLISVVIAEIVGKALYIREFVMSCRVLKRGMEAFIFKKIHETASSRGLEMVVGDYIPTPKNRIVENLFTDHGFTRSPDKAEYAYESDLKKFVPSPNFIKEKRS